MFDYHDRVKVIIIIFIFSLNNIVITSMSSFSRFSLNQSMNIPAIRQSLLLFNKPSLAIPHIELDNLNDLDIKYLKSKGIKYLIFDKDQTLSNTYSDHFHPNVISIINKLKSDDTFSIAILSNSVGSNDDKNYEGFIQ
jgi:phosphatidylglycerophosphatase GEP4